MKFFDWKILSLLCLMALLLNGCLPDDEDNDPCACIKPVSADFAIYEKVGSIYYIADTAISTENSSIRLIAVRYDSLHTWQVNDVQNSETGYIAYLDAFEANQQVNIVHTITATARPDCYPGEDDHDTTSASFYVTLPEQSPVFGTYRGSMDFAPLDTFEFTIAFTNPLGLPEPRAYVQNFPNGNFIELETDEGDYHTWSQPLNFGGSNVHTSSQQQMLETFYVDDIPNVKHNITAWFRKTGMAMRVAGTIRIETMTSPGVYEEEVTSYVFSGYKISQ